VNDQDYIRKAVKLADGWRWFSLSTDHEKRYAIIINGKNVGIPENLANLPEFIKDALSAQLVKQADRAFKDWRCLELFEGHTAVRRFEPLSETGEDLAACYGEGRAMNTIKTIVDSKKLEKQ